MERAGDTGAPRSVTEAWDRLPEAMLVPASSPWSRQPRAIPDWYTQRCSDHLKAGRIGSLTRSVLCDDPQRFGLHAVPMPRETALDIRSDLERESEMDAALEVYVRPVGSLAARSFPLGLRPSDRRA